MYGQDRRTAPPARFAAPPPPLGCLESLAGALAAAPHIPLRRMLRMWGGVAARIHHAVRPIPFASQRHKQQELDLETLRAWHVSHQYMWYGAGALELKAARSA